MCAIQNSVCTFFSDFTDEWDTYFEIQNIHTVQIFTHIFIHLRAHTYTLTFWTTETYELEKGFEGTCEEWEGVSPAKECTAFGQRIFLVN